MVRGATVLTVPNPHHGDISIGLLKLVLEQAGVSRRSWKSV
jgi:hypothetical protein